MVDSYRVVDMFSPIVEWSVALLVMSMILGKRLLFVREYS
jgi:hypothetical protein